MGIGMGVGEKGGMREWRWMEVEAVGREERGGEEKDEHERCVMMRALGA